MNKKSRFRLAALCMSALSLLAFPSCSDSDEPSSGEEEEGTLAVKEVTLSRKTGYGDDWIYYSLSQGKEVTVAEENHQTDLTWDLAFNRCNVRTNSGLSGNGKGGAQDTGKTSLDAVEEVPAGTFTTDVTAKITASFTGTGITEMESTLNPLLTAAVTVDTSNPPPKYIPNEHVYIVRTADGNYAKIQIEGFYNDEGVSGFVTFSYVYQPDGSTNLKSR